MLLLPAILCNCVVNFFVSTWNFQFLLRASNGYFPSLLVWIQLPSLALGYFVNKNDDWLINVICYGVVINELRYFNFPVVTSLSNSVTVVIMNNSISVIHTHLIALFKFKFKFKLISYHIISYHIISYHIISYHIISYHIISYHIISYHIISYHIIS